MKKLSLLIFTMLFVLILSSCKPVADTEAPVITQVASMETTFTEGDVEPNWGTYFTIEDDTDGVIQLTNSMIEEDVDMLTPGTYTVTLTVVDEAGNESTSSITITVEEEVFVPVGDIIATYEGVAPIGMGDSGTLVTINFFDDGTFDLHTSKLRGEGVYAIDGGVITLTYEDEHPDGGEWVLSGTINTTDVTDVTTEFTIDPVEYAINMGDGPIVMDVGTTDFVIVVGTKAVISLVPDMQTTFLLGDTAPDWKAYFTVEDETDGTITVTDEMITDEVDFDTEGMYFVTLEVTNSSGNTTSKSLFVFIEVPGLINTFEGISEAEGMFGALDVAFEIFDNNTFVVYQGGSQQGVGTYTLVDTTITFTFVDPVLDYENNPIGDIVGTVSDVTLSDTATITTETTNVPVAMGPMIMVVDYGPMTFETEPILSVSGVSTAEGIFGSREVGFNLYEDGQFKAYQGGAERGIGTYEIVDTAITLTYTNPTKDYQDVDIPVVEGVLSNIEFDGTTTLTTEATNVPVDMGGMVMTVDYGPMVLETTPVAVFEGISTAEGLFGALDVMFKIYEDGTYRLYQGGSSQGVGTYTIDGTAVVFTLTDPLIDYENNDIPVIEATLSSETLSDTVTLTTVTTPVPVAMGGMVMVVDYGAMVFEIVPVITFEGTSTAEGMFGSLDVAFKLYADGQFRVYQGGSAQGVGLYTIDDVTITFTFTDPTEDYQSVAIADIVGTLSEATLSETTTLSITVTAIPVDMGGMVMVVDYEDIVFTVPTEEVTE